MRSELGSTRRAPTGHIPSWLAFAAAMLGMVPLGCDGGDGKDDSSRGVAKPVYVELVTLAPELMSDVVALTGQLASENTGTVKSEIAGAIEDIRFEEGQRVEKGDILFTLRDREQRALLMEADAEQRLAQDVYDRTQRLTSRDVVSQARRAESLAGLDKAKARTDLARLRLDRTRIRAPFDGVLGTRTVAPGDRVEDEDPLVTILAIDRLQAIFSVQEVAVPLARVGLPIHARVIAFPDERFPGEVFFVSPNVDPGSRRLILKAWLENSDHRLKPGMFVNVDVEIARKEAALLVPESAIVYDRNGIFVWREAEESKAEKIPVELGVHQGGRVEVLTGLAPGDRIVAAGTHKVLAGEVLRDATKGIEEDDPAANHARGREPEAKREEES